MNNRDKVIRYMEGDMTPGEKKEFEAELLVSEELNKEVKLYKQLMSSIDEIKNIPVDQNYNASIIPRFRLKQTHTRKKYLPAYAALTVAAALLLLFLNVPRQHDENTISNTASVEVSDSVMNVLTELDSNIDSIVTNNEEYSAAVDEMLNDELNISEKELDSLYYSAYSGSSQSISEISEEESQIVYDEIINKRFF